MCWSSLSLTVHCDGMNAHVDAGSFLGVGTDIGGSLRLPAAFSGICALKPTDRRVSKLGGRSSVPGQEAVPGVVSACVLSVYACCMGCGLFLNVQCLITPTKIGPMAPANQCSTLALFMRTVCTPKMWELDHSVVPLPFNESEYQSSAKLKVCRVSAYKAHMCAHIVIRICAAESLALFILSA